jgi:hypothetical protein
MKIKMMRLARGGSAGCGCGLPEFELEAVGENRGAAVAGFAARAWSATEAKPQPTDCNSCLRLVQGVAGASDAGIGKPQGEMQRFWKSVRTGKEPAASPSILQDCGGFLK